MLLALDIGNSNVTTGSFRAGVLVATRRAAVPAQLQLDGAERDGGRPGRVALDPVVAAGGVILVTITLLTECLTLEPGDVIAMGTPAGVGQARTPPVWMRHGDVVEIDIQGIGVLTNPIRNEVR